MRLSEDRRVRSSRIGARMTPTWWTHVTLSTRGGVMVTGGHGENSDRISWVNERAERKNSELMVPRGHIL